MEERKACNRLLCETGRRLAAQGAAVLRFDPRGCGDAPASFEDFSIAGWTADLRAASCALRQLHPGVPQIWLGVRAGAMLALRLASETAEAARTDALVLWEPVLGPAFVHQLLQRRMVNEMMAYGQVRTGRQSIEASLARGQTVDFDGFPISGRLYRELQELLPAPWAGPGLIVSTGPDTRAADACLRLMPATTCRALRLPPFWNTVGIVDARELIETTDLWIEGQRAEGGGQTSEGRGQRADVRGQTSEGGGQTSEGSGSAFDLLPFLSGDSSSCATPNGAERIIAIPGAHGCIRGVLHLPATDRPRGRIVFLHGWSGDRTGPHRMFVHAARRLARLGFTCLRFDYRGRGDSDAAASGSASIDTMTSDARAAIAWLRTEAPHAGPITLLAICSGCKIAIHAAAAEPDIARLALWSAEAMGSLRGGTAGLPRRLALLRTYARKLLQRETWGKLLRGQVRTGMVGRALVQAEVRTPAEARAEDETLRVFRAFRGSILFVFGGSDPDTPGSSRAYTAYCRTASMPHICHVIPHAGHSYYGMDWEQEVLRVTEAWLEEPAAGDP
ncbi:MAG: alpha/beta fold hydrolase [bacterium]